MKKLIPGLSIFIIAIIACTSLIIKHTNKPGATVSKGDAEEIEGYYKWELQRLADPSTGKIPDNIRNLELEFAAGLPNDLQDNRRKEAGSAGLWKMRGPWNIGGRTRAFAADINNEAILLAGTAAGGMWRSTDSGKTWNLTTPLAQEQSVSCLAQDIRNGYSNIWYYGSGECTGASASATGAYYLGNGLYRSTDDGQTWSVLASTSFNSFTFSNYWQAIWSVATDPSRTDSSLVYVSTIGELNRSADSGRTWKTVLGGGSTYSYYTNVIVTPEGVVYASFSSDGPQFGIWRSVDGINFTNITPPDFPITYNRIVMCYAPTDHNQLYFLANSPGYGTPDTNFLNQVEWNSLWKYKYLSGDGDSSGGTWTNLSPNLPSTGGLFDKYNCQGSYDMVVSFLPADTSTVFIGGTDIFRSTTGFYDAGHTAHIGGYAVGASLPSIKVYPGDHPDQHVLFFSKTNPYIMYSGCDGGLFKTLDDTASNVSWSTFDSGYITTMMYTITSNHVSSGSPILVAGLQDNDCIFDNSLLLTNFWTKPIFGDGSFCSIADSGKTFYYETTTGHLFKTQMDTTNGTVAAFNRIDPIGGTNYQWLNPYVIDPNNNSIMYFGGGKYLWRNNNLSAIPLSNMWDSISTNWIQWPDSVPVSGAYITAMAVSTYPANIVYFGTSNQHVYRVDSANTGTPTIRDISSIGGYNGFPSDAFVTCIAVDPDSADRVIVVYSNYATRNLFYSRNAGETWARIGGNLNPRSTAEQPSLRWASIQHLSSGGTIYWLGASTGLYATDTLMDSVTVWVQQATNTIGNSICDMVDVRQSDGLVAVATHTHGAYTANITSLNDITTVHNLNPVNTDLAAEIYPNPSSGRAFIRYYSPDQENIQLKIYNESGMVVQQTQLTNNRGGYNIHQVDLSQQATGIYFCSLVISGETKTIRMLVIK